MTNISLSECNFYVYLHSRLNTGEPFYIGKGQGKRAFNKQRRNRYWNQIVDKDGGFYTSFLATDIDEELAWLVEIEAIALFKLRLCSLANITPGGEGASGYFLSAETKAKLSAALKGKPGWNKGKKTSKEILAKLSIIRTGKKHTEEHKLNISNALKGKKKSDEARENMRIACIGRPSNNKGKTFSDEHRANISKANTGKTHTPETRLKMSELMKGKPAWNKGKKHSAETRLKMSLAHEGKPTGRKGIARPMEVREKIAATLRGRTLTAEHAENISRGLKGRKNER